MKASVLMPTRERVEMCKESIESLGEGDFEVLLYVDDDDSQKEQYEALASDKVRVFVLPRLTYYRFHEMINFLAKNAKGDWLLLWNDDAFMHGEWLKHLDDYDHDEINVMRFGHSPNKLNLFPAISRKLYDTQGYYSQSPHCDSWAMDLSKDLDCERWVFGMEIEHRRDETSLADDTKAHSVEAYKTTVPQHNSSIVQSEYQRMLRILSKEMK